jgi:hypothetical protein
VHFGEGAYPETEAAIRALLEDAGARDLPPPTAVDVEQASTGTQTPETYFGLSRRQGFVPDDKRTAAVEREPAAHDRLEPGQFTLAGTWELGLESATAGRSARVAGRVRAQRVFMVLSPPEDGKGAATVSIDGAPIEPIDSGSDLKSGMARIDRQRLYRLVDLDAAEDFLLEVELSPGTKAFTFTFG